MIRVFSSVILPGAQQGAAGGAGGAADHLHPPGTQWDGLLLTFIHLCLHFKKLFTGPT